MNDEVKAFLEAAPPLTEENIEEINACFRPLLFMRRSTCEVAATCCRRLETLPPEHPIWQEQHMTEPRHYWTIKPEKLTPCPFCGRLGTVKEWRYTGRRKNLWEEHRIAVLRWDGGSLWVSCAWAKKDYEDKSFDHAIDPPQAAGGPVYRFWPDRVESVACSWYCWYHYRIDVKPYSTFGKETVDRPFGWNNEERMGYTAIAMGELAKTPVRYCKAEDYKGDLIKFLHLAHVYPRQVEMLMKAGMETVVRDFAERGVKHARVLDWAGGGWKLPKADMRAFLRELPEGERAIGILELLLTLRRKGEQVTVERAAEVWELHRYHREWLKEAERWGLRPMELYRYLERQTVEKVWNAANRYSIWMDYLRLAGKLGYPMQRSDALLPQDLSAAHDAAVEKFRRRADEIHRAEQLRRVEAEKAVYEPRREKLEARYGWAAGGYIIRAPKNRVEIEDEGRILRHCVGGYADRHVEGKVTILFLRKARTPDKPFLTIEMDGAKLKQIHGYRNEGIYTCKGRFAKDPREKFRWLLDPWLEWVAKGSRRRKDGSPVLPKHKEVTA